MKSDIVERKFIESFDLDEWEIETDDGWQDISAIHKTIEYTEWRITTISGKQLICADNHIVFNDNNEEIFVKDLIPSVSIIKTIDGDELIIDVVKTNNFSNMYDVSVNSINHRYYSNGILSHNSTTMVGYITWYIIFNEYKSVAILANKQKAAINIFGRVQFMLMNLPSWLQQGVVEWNKTSLKLENGSSCMAAATSPSGIRSESISLLMLDEFAHMNSNLADEFIKSVFPTISSSVNSKMVIVSTPNGLNHYYKIWNEAEQNINGFIAIKAHWTEHPKRDQAWADQQLKELGKIGFSQEVLCEFLGSSYTLIDGNKLASLTFNTPIYQSNNFEVLKKPEKDNSYVISIDVSRGAHRDYSAFSVINVSKVPYEVCAIYKDNTISTMEFPHLIYNTAKQYNDAYLLIEINDLGEEVANILWYDYEYEYLYFSSPKGLSEYKGHPGVRTTAKVKGLGCSLLKDLIEKDQLIVNFFKIIEELSIFVLQRKSYGADNPIINDDLCTTLWLFAWLTHQPEFQEVVDINIRNILAEKKSAMIDQSMTPFGFFSDGSNEELLSSNLPVLDNPNMTDAQRSLLF